MDEGKEEKRKKSGKVRSRNKQQKRAAVFADGKHLRSVNKRYGGFQVLVFNVDRGDGSSKRFP